MASEQLHVLVLDDLEMVRNFIGRVLESAGYSVSFAPDGNDALLMLATTCVDLIVSDLGMPGMSGTQLGALVSLLPNAPPILYVSGECFRPDGIPHSHYLQKPFTGDQLKQAAAAVLDQVRERRDAS